MFTQGTGCAWPSAVSGSQNPRITAHHRIRGFGNGLFEAEDLGSGWTSALKSREERLRTQIGARK